MWGLGVVHAGRASSAGIGRGEAAFEAVRDGRARPLGWAARGRYVAAVTALAAVYYAAAKLGYELEFAGPVAAVVWFPAGVAISFLFLGGLRLWPGVLAGDLLVNDYSALPLGSALGQTFGNMLEVIVAVLLMRRLGRGAPPLEGIGGVARMIAALAAGTAVSAVIGPLSLRAGGVLTTAALPDVARTWWLGDACGALVVVPLAVAWHAGTPRGAAHRSAVEAALMITTVAVVSEIAFRGEQPLAYLVFPALGWAALRFGWRGATLAVAVAVGFAVWNTTHYYGPFVFHSLTLSVLSTQLYIAVAAVSTLCLAAVVSERAGFAAGLDASRSRLVKASDTERRRLEQDLHDGAQQRLSALAVRLGLAADRTRGADEPGAQVLDAAGAEVSLAIDELRALAHGIHPAILTNLGLAAAVKELALRSAVPVTVVDLPSRRFDESVEATAYFVFAETLTNVQKHARASSVRIRATATARALRLDIADDGVGGAAESGGDGLKGLRDRVQALGGTLEIHSPAGRGTHIAVTIPESPAAR